MTLEKSGLWASRMREDGIFVYAKDINARMHLLLSGSE